jgi:hypothetical protein
MEGLKIAMGVLEGLGAGLIISGLEGEGEGFKPT